MTRAVSALGVLLFTTAVAAEQLRPEPLDLSRAQRTALQAIVAAVDAGTPALDVSEDTWPLDVLRASDGSHYIAFSLLGVPDLPRDRAAVVYVRLATRPAAGTATATERSAVAEWLAGRTPPPPRGRSGIAFGDMPTFGPGGIAARGPGAQTQTLRLMELERERAREKREEESRARKAALEGAEAARRPRPLLPFEDFDVRRFETSAEDGTVILRRSVTAGPGEYDLVVGWADPGARDVAGSVRIVRRALSLPPASMTDLALSSVIVADRVALRETPHAPSEQTAFPYSIGSLEIVPARDRVLTPDERLSLVVQVINARGSATGKPDVEVGFRVFRQAGGREELVGSLAAQQYNELTLPLDFDVARRHPIFAAVAVPLTAFRRGEYRMEITATDRIAAAAVRAETRFTVVGTPASLLREAPPLAPRFDAAAIAGPLQQALQQASSPLAVQLMRGAQRAGEGNDLEAIAVWEAAIDAGADRTLVAPLLIDALLRRNEHARAITLARSLVETGAASAPLVRQLAAAYLAAGRAADALDTLDRHLQQMPADEDARWLAIHALFTGFVTGTGPGADDAGRQRLSAALAEYIAAGASHAVLAREWLGIIE